MNFPIKNMSVPAFVPRSLPAQIAAVGAMVTLYVARCAFTVCKDVPLSATNYLPPATCGTHSSVGLLALAATAVSSVVAFKKKAKPQDVAQAETPKAVVSTYYLRSRVVNPK